MGLAARLELGSCKAIPTPCYADVYGATAQIAGISYGGGDGCLAAGERWLAIRAEVGWFSLPRGQGWRQGGTALEVSEAADCSLPRDNRRASGSGSGEAGS